MIYPIRSLRFHQDMARAKARLSARLRVLYLQRINHKKYPKQPVKKGLKHVSFKGVTTVCEYEQEVGQTRLL